MKLHTSLFSVGSVKGVGFEPEYISLPKRNLTLPTRVSNPTSDYMQRRCCWQESNLVLLRAPPRKARGCRRDAVGLHGCWKKLPRKYPKNLKSRRGTGAAYSGRPRGRRGRGIRGRAYSC